MTELLVPIRTRPRWEGLLFDHSGPFIPDARLDAIATGDGPRGTNQAADILRETADGVDLNRLWNEFQRVIRMWNDEREPLINLLTFRVTGPIEEVGLPPEVDFEEATEYGVPKGIRTGGEMFQAGYGFKWWDIAIRYTWMFLADAQSAQITALNNQALDADSRLMFTKVLRQVFNPTNSTTKMNQQALNVFPFYNADGNAPPPYRSRQFDGTHTHYLASQGAVVDPVDLQDIEDHLWHHGYRITNGYRFVLLVNRQEGLVIRTFERGVDGARYDFIPNENAFGGGIIMPDGRVIGAPQMANFPDMMTIGTYGPFVIVEEDYMPEGYMFGFATGGEDNLGNPIGIREHERANLRGLRLVKGAVPDYPLTDSFYLHGFGTGVRHRGAGVLMQVTPNAVYAPPAQYA